MDAILNIYNVYFDIWWVKFTIQGFNLIKQIPLSLVFGFAFVCFNDIVSINIYDKCDDFSISQFYMVMFPALHLMGFIFLNSYTLQEQLAVLQTSTLELNF